MGNGTWVVEKDHKRNKTRSPGSGPNVRIVGSHKQALLMRLMAERLGVVKDDGMSLHEILEDNYDGIMEEYHAGPH